MYTKISDTVVMRNSDKAFIPVTLDNVDYRNYLTWVDEGNVADVYVEPVVVPSVVTMRQARLALLQAGKLASVTAAINNLSSPQKEAAQIEWEYSAEVHRDKQLVQLLAPVLGLTDQDLDDLFTLAASL